MNKQPKYGVKLTQYKGQEINLFVHEDGLWTGNRQEAEDKAKEYDLRNPGGCYCVEAV